MAEQVRQIAPAARRYSGSVTDPARWALWAPRAGDVLVCTPAKCGTTWTQGIIAMLLSGSAELPGPVPVISPWVDGDLKVPAEQVAADLAAQTGRRVVKTHTPGDGLDLWEGVPVVAVYRHPLDVFLSLRKHLANRNRDISDHPLLQAEETAYETWLTDPTSVDSIDEDRLSSLVLHYRETVLTGRVPGVIALHYADMMRDRAGAVTRLAHALQIDVAPDALAQIIAATSFDTMRENAGNYTPVAGTGFWKSDKGFFASGGTEKWRSALSADQIARFEARLSELVPEEDARHWLLYGSGG